MASGLTNKGLYRLLGTMRGDALPANFYLALVTNANVPGSDTNVLSDLTEIAAGNGYTSGGQAISLDHTDFDVHIEDDANDESYIQLKDYSWTASGGSMPSSGDGAAYAVLLDDNATIADREVYGYLGLGGAITKPDGEALKLQDGEFKLSS